METKIQGFTIIEVMLFLAISASMLIGVFVVSGSLISQTRFTDSLRGLESFLKREYEEVSSGVNTRGSVACSGSDVSTGTQNPGTSGCLLLGRVIIFRAGTSVVESLTVVGSESTTSPSSSASLETILAAYTPKTVPSSLTTYTIPWSGSFTAGRRQGPPPAPANAIAILRSPTSSQIGIYHFSTTLNVATANPLSTYLIAEASNTVASYCVDSGDGPTGSRKGAIDFMRAQGSTAIEANFDLSAGAPC